LEKIRFAFALNEHDEFENEHFGDTARFSLFDWTGDSFKHSGEIENHLTEDNHDHNLHAHGDRKKGQKIIQLLKQHHVQALVSRQFGKNIEQVRRHFLIVVTRANNKKITQELLTQNMETIRNSLFRDNDSSKPVFLKEKNNRMPFQE
jgi:predicted Fe-Mo cluster-binding NifX family protein